MKNFAQMMKQAEMTRVECEGRSGGGLVTVVLNGKGDMVRLRLDRSLLKPEEGEILEDLIVAAHNDAKAKTEVLIQEKMKTLTGGLPLPPGLKLF